MLCYIERIEQLIFLYYVFKFLIHYFLLLQKLLYMSKYKENALKCAKKNGLDVPKIYRNIYISIPKFVTLALMVS